MITTHDIRVLNGKILYAERRYGKESQIVQRIYSTIRHAYGNEQQTRFRKINYTDESLRDINIKTSAFNVVRNSAYLSKKGREGIYTKALEKFKNNNLDKYDEGRIEELYDIYVNTIKPTLKERVERYSDIIIDLTDYALNQNLTDNDMGAIADKYIKYTKRAKKSPMDFPKYFQREIKKIIKEKEAIALAAL